MERFGEKLFQNTLYWRLFFQKGGAYTVANFVDEYERQLDDHGRIIMPSKIREVLGATVYVTQSPSERCLYIYTEEEWALMSQKINLLPTATDKNAAAFVRLFFGKATACSVDKQGRVAIAKRLIDYAHLLKDVVLVGANTRLELWDANAWNEYQSGLSDDIILDGILKYDLNI